MVVRSYAEYAIRAAFGDAYAVDVAVAGSVPLHIKTIGEWSDYIDEELSEPARDCNHLVTATADSYGGVDNSIEGVHGDLPALDPGCVSRKGHGRTPYKLNRHLHEIGHCLGMSHRGIEAQTDDGAIPPMATGYVEGSYHIHEYCPTSVSEFDTYATQS